VATVWYSDVKVTELVTATPRKLAEGKKAPNILILRTRIEERLAETSVLFIPC
jgi:hypothetical protein